MYRLLAAIAIGIALAGTGIYAWKHYETLVTERQQFKEERNLLRAELATAARTIETQHRERKRLDALLAKRERDRDARARELEKARHEINELRTHADPEVAQWANERVPDAAYERLCNFEPAACAADPARRGAGEPDATNAHAEPRALEDERGPDSTFDRGAGSAPTVQR